VTAEERPAARVTTQVILGLVIVAFGLLLMAGNLGWVDVDRASEYWPLVFVAFGVAKILQSRGASGRIMGGIFVLIGGLWTAEQVYRLPIRFWDWWPVLLVWAGVTMLLRTRRHSIESAGPTTERGASEFAFWSGVRRRIASSAFQHADLTAVMGGIEIDLRPAATAAGEAVLDVFVLWGSIEILVPPDWVVSNRVVAIMGGADDKSTGTQGARHRLTIRGFVMMGGIVIKT
jgi:predicted membrane protein